MGSGQPAIRSGAMIEVEGPDGAIYEFPEGTPVDVMHKAMAQRFPPKPPARSNWDVFTDIMPTLNAVKKGATTPFFPAGQMMREALPKEQMSPGKETAAGIGLAGADVVEALSTPATLGFGAGAALLGSQGLPGMIATGAFSLDQLKNAYRAYQRGQELSPEALPRERIASKGTAVADAIMALLPWKIRSKGIGMPKSEGLVASPRPELRAARETILNPTQRQAPQLPLTVPGPAPAPVAPKPAPFVPEDVFVGPQEPWYVKRDRQKALEQSQQAPMEGIAGNTGEISGHVPWDVVEPVVQESKPQMPVPRGYRKGNPIPKEQTLSGWIASKGGVNIQPEWDYGRLKESGISRATYNKLANSKGKGIMADELFMRVKEAGFHFPDEQSVFDALMSPEGRRLTRTETTAPKLNLEEEAQWFLDKITDEAYRDSEWRETHSYDKEGNLYPEELERMQAEGDAWKPKEFDPSEEGFADITLPPSELENTKKAAFRKKWEDYKKRLKEHVDKNIAAAADADVIELRRTDPEMADRYTIIHRSTNMPGKWQASSFDKDGPWGHEVYGTKEDAIRSFSGENTKEGPSYGAVGEYYVARTRKLKGNEEGFADIKQDRTLPEGVYSIGFQDLGNGKKAEMFNDSRTGSTLMVMPGDSLQEKLAASRKAFGREDSSLRQKYRDEGIPEDILSAFDDELLKNADPDMLRDAANNVFDPESWIPSDPELLRSRMRIVRKKGEEGFADQKGFDFDPISIPGASKGKAAEDLFTQILKAPESNVSKREQLGLNKKKGKEASTPLFNEGGLFGK